MNKKKKTESEKYVKLTQIEHCLLRPENYIGSVVSEKEELYVVKDNNLSNIEVIKKEVLNNQGFSKIFSEILDNASDHYLRGGGVKLIKVDIGDKKIIIKNDGTTIPIQIHEKEKIYIPTLVFFNLLSGSNYDDTEDRATIGRNGLGSSLTAVFSNKFMIECCDGKQIFKQMATDNLSKIHEPIITKCSPGTKSYTKVTYYPDFEKFGIDEITEDLKSVLYKKTLDTAAYIPNVRVSLDSKTIPLKTAKDYMLMHVDKETDFFYEELENGWKVGICKSSGHSFEHVTLVNSTNLYKGGTLTNYIALELSKDINDKFKKSIKSSWTDVKNRLFVFIIADIINPSFDSQSKTLITTSMTNQITGGCKVGEKTIRKIMKSDIVQSILDEIELKEKLSLRKIGGGKKTKVNLPKLVDANKAGTRESNKCSLFLTEGDCLAEDTKVFIMRDGIKHNIKIKDIEINDVVITHESNFSIVTSISKKIGKSCKIKLKNEQILICSENHKWFIYDTILDKFSFVSTKDLDITIHKMVKNKNVKFDKFHKIKRIDKITDTKYHKNLFLENGETFLSTNEHKFTVLNLIDGNFKMVKCEDLDIDNDFLVDYISL